ncbi:MAG: Lrp/AsnC family transcriptional regulator [Candidatus Pacearchaeota archaeon]
MSYNLDLYDWKMLYELDKDSSQDVSKLAKTLRRSKQFIAYRMKRLEEEKIIEGYHAIVDMSKLGYFTFRVYFKFQQMSDVDGKEFVEYVKTHHSQVWTITAMHGKWDYAIFLGVKTIAEFHRVWDEILRKYKRHIKQYNVAVYAPIHNFNRKFFVEATKPVVERIYGVGQEEKIDATDLSLIDMYSKQVRISSITLGEKLGISDDAVRKRIKSLVERKIIVGYKLGLNLEKLGYTGYRVDLQLTSTHRNTELFEFCRNHRYIYQVNKSIGGADFEIEVIVRDRSHLLMLIEEIKLKFSDVVNDVEYFGFSIFHLLSYIPD